MSTLIFIAAIVCLVLGIIEGLDKDYNRAGFFLMLSFIFFFLSGR